MEDSGTRWRRWWRPDVALTLVAVAAGIAGAMLGGQYLQRRAAEAEASLAGRYERRQVVVAATDVEQGSQFGAGNLALRSVPAEFLPADAMTAERAGELMGAVAVIDIARGTPIVPAVLASTMPAPRLAQALANDERALTVAVDDLDSQAGALRAGDRIDLFFSQREAGRALLVPLLQRVEILGTGDSFTVGQGEDFPRHFVTVTLRVPAAEAPRILLAQQAGELSMLLRSRDDLALQPTGVRNSSELLRQAQPVHTGASVELLIGGHGDQVPERRLLRVGAGRAGGAA